MKQISEKRTSCESVAFVAYNSDETLNDLMRARSFVAVQQTVRARRLASVSDEALTRDEYQDQTERLRKREIASYSKLSPSHAKQSHDNHASVKRHEFCTICEQLFTDSDELCEHLQAFAVAFDFDADSIALLIEAIDLLSTAIESNDVYAIRDARVSLDRAYAYANKCSKEFRTSVRGRRNRQLKKDRSNVCKSCNTQLASRATKCFYCD